MTNNRGDWMRTAASTQDVLDDIRSAREANMQYETNEPSSPGLEVALERCEEACTELLAAFDELIGVLK